MQEGCYAGTQKIVGRVFMMVARRLQHVALFLLPTMACGVPPGEGELMGTICTTGARPALQVTVVDGTTPKNESVRLICDAEVIAHIDATDERLQVSNATGTCYYSGAMERPGTYSVSGKRGVRIATLNSVVVGKTSNNCHVMTENLTIELN